VVWAVLPPTPRRAPKAKHRCGWTQQRGTARLDWHAEAGHEGHRKGDRTTAAQVHNFTSPQARSQAGTLAQAGPQARSQAGGQRGADV
jgi:hypothetical protein